MREQEEAMSSHRSGSVLVTGGAGFIGSHVCDAFLSDGWRVTAIDDLSSGRLDNLDPAVDFHRVDIRSDEARELIAGGRFDVVSHHAAQIDVRLSVSDPRHDASINIDGLLNVLEGCVAGAVNRLILISSGGVVYGESAPIPTLETAEKQPLSPYGVSKFTGENYLYFYRRIHGLEGVALRYSNVYGPRQDPHGEAGVVSIFSQKILRGETITIFGDGEQTRDYVYVGDVAAANLVAAAIDIPDPEGIDDVAFNVGVGVETTVNELARTLISVAEREVEVVHEPARPGELLRSCLDAGKLRARGWSPQKDLALGLSATYTHIAETL
jgi:UDP-glucose 4-epimerase